MSEKQVLIDLGNVRIKEYNSMNHVIEIYEEVRKFASNEVEKKWRFHGYCSTILEGLESIQRNELLLDKTKISTLNDHLKQVKESNNKILLAINKIKKSTKSALEVMQQ